MLTAWNPPECQVENAILGVSTPCGMPWWPPSVRLSM
jgi:hypothetical protein